MKATLTVSNEMPSPIATAPSTMVSILETRTLVPLVTLTAAIEWIGVSIMHVVTTSPKLRRRRSQAFGHQEHQDRLAHQEADRVYKAVETGGVDQRRDAEKRGRPT